MRAWMNTAETAEMDQNHSRGCLYALIRARARLTAQNNSCSGRGKGVVVRRLPRSVRGGAAMAITPVPEGFGPVRSALLLVLLAAASLTALTGTFVAAAGASTGTAYVTGGDAVTPINLATNLAGNSITVGTRPYGIAITPNGDTAYVTNEGSNTVTPITLATKETGLEIHV